MDLLPGTNNTNVFLKIVFPNFIGIILTSQECFDIPNTDISANLTKVCKYAYGGRLKIDMDKGSIAFVLVSLFCSNMNTGLLVALFRLARGSAQ